MRMDRSVLRPYATRPVNTKRSLLQLINNDYTTPLSHVRAFGDCPDSRTTRLINFVLLPAIGDSSSQLQTELFSLSNGREVDAEAKPESESSRDSEKIDGREAKGAVAYCETGTVSSLKRTVSFTVTPDEKRLLLLDEVEDSQVTSLVRKLRSGEPFEVEDFPGGDSSFSPKLEIKDAGGLVKDEKLGPDPVHRRNLRLCKAVPVEIEDISSS
ncbi:hypothetical protein Bca52824_017591 [Brassica carinata]|uniref:Uncharacterized protein n=1 Tax=Brassica carinata TaxID=52824 RepID=A0A8X8AVJ4_BRACI|nr:hypothetical protein Bca52824_017591 [Brassica carinata]